MSKYIINTDTVYGFDIYKSMLLMGTNGRGEVIVQKFNLDELEELNADYINGHYGSLQDEAYQRGLDDAWEAAKKISLMPPDEIEKVFPGAAKYNRYNLGYSGVEAIERLKAYEEKQKADDEIKVGDVVEWDGTPLIVTRIYQPFHQKEQCDGIDDDGCVYEAVLTEGLTKTGRHFDIGDMLKGINRT